MAFQHPHSRPPAGLPSIHQRTLPSFNHFVSTLGHTRPERPQPLVIEKSSTFPEASRVERQTPLPSPISDAPHPPQRVERGGFSHLLNPVEEQPNKAATAPTPSPLSPWRPLQTPRDAYEMRQGLMPGMKPLQPRGSIPPVMPAPTPFPLRSTSTEQDLTLAGKPRKRSAQACHRCRDMKIKCRLQGSGCITCMRQGLGCTFEPTKTGLRQRRGKRGPDSVMNTSGGDIYSVKRTRSELSQPKESSLAIPSRFDTAGSHEATARQQPRMREEQHLGATRFPPTPPAEYDAESRATWSHQTRSTQEMAPWHVPDLTIDTNPWIAAPALTTRALQAFYSNVHKRCGEVVVPAREPSTNWKYKSGNERMLHYALLAAGASSCLESQWSEELETYGRACRGIAEDALRSAGYMFDKTVVQTQMILKAMTAPGAAPNRAGLRETGMNNAEKRPW